MKSFKTYSYVTGSYLKTTADILAKKKKKVNPHRLSHFLCKFCLWVIYSYGCERVMYWVLAPGLHSAKFLLLVTAK